MRQILVFVVISTIIPCVSIAQGTNDWDVLRKQVKTLREELARQGAYAFVTNRTTTPRIAPHIHSQCWVDWLPKEEKERREYEQEKRDFGLDLWIELEELSMTKIPLEDIDALEHHADRMLTISEWLKTSKGYGNLILKVWGECIAMSAMGGMAVNSDCDTNRVQRLMSRVEGLRENITRRVFVLNEESPHHYKMPECCTLDDAQKDLERQLHPHKVKTLEYYGKKDNRRNFSFDKVKCDPPEYAFYVPDIKDSIVPLPRSWWSMKKYDTFCLYGGDEIIMAGQIREILRWRAGIGDIPKPTEEQIKDINLAPGYRSRLHDVWRKWTGGRESLFPSASAVVKVYGNTFVDSITRQLQLNAERLKRGKMPQ